MAQANAVTSGRPGATHRVAPSYPVALGVVVAYTVVFVGLARSSGFAYEDLFSSTTSTLRGAVLPLLAGGVVLAVFLWWSRWDGIPRDRPRLRSPRVLWALPVIMLVMAALGLLGTDWAALTPGHAMAILAAAALVGVTEETLFRGIVLRSLRTGRRGEGAAFGWTCVTFGLFHLSNLALGEWGAPIQVVLTTLIGVGLYLGRRLVAHLVGAMVLHAGWDAASFAHGSAPRPGAADDAYNGFIALFVIAAVTAAVVVLRSDRRPG